MSGVYERYRNLSDKEFFKNAINIRVEITKLMASDKVVPKSYRLMSAVPTQALRSSIRLGGNAGRPPPGMIYTTQFLKTPRFEGFFVAQNTGFLR